MMPKTPVALLGVACLLLCLGGCARGKGNVSGKVTFEGKPLQFGTVTMAGDYGVPHSGQILRDGTYTVSGVPYGNFKVAVSSPDPNPPEVKLPEGFKHPTGKELPKRVEVDSTGWFPIPGEYSRLSQSGLSVKVDKKDTTFDIPLKEIAPKEAPAP
jgi:hypothetical protein